MWQQIPSSNAIAEALTWLEATFLGSVASTAAVIAIAWFGLLILSGRMDVRRGMEIILGCFIIFGAAAIARGIEATMLSAAGPPELRDGPTPRLPPAIPARPAAGTGFDPYARATSPSTR